jgi:hypothetical protein
LESHNYKNGIQLLVRKSEPEDIEAQVKALKQLQSQPAFMPKKLTEKKVETVTTQKPGPRKGSSWLGYCWARLKGLLTNSASIRSGGKPDNGHMMGGPGKGK